MTSIVDTLGERIKIWEHETTGIAFEQHKPVCVRIDGRSFHTWTKGMERPYEVALADLMVETTKYLVEETNAKIGYTQSDEISLILYNSTPVSQILFNGKHHKLISVIASMATAKFNQMAQKVWPDKSLATFDCRAFSAPDEVAALDVLKWRQHDATRNSISMSAQAHFSHKQLQNKSCKEMLAMLEAIDKNWDFHPSWFQNGTFIKKATELVPIDPETLAKIPVDKRPPPSALVTRHRLLEHHHRLDKMELTDQIDYVFGPVDLGNLKENTLTV